MTISNKWSKILASVVGTDNAKYVVAVRCAMENEQKFNDKSYATMKFAFIKAILKKYKQTCDDERMININVDEPSLDNEDVRKIVRQWASAESKATYEIHRRNSLWDDEKYEAAMTKLAKNRKRKSTAMTTAAPQQSAEIPVKKTNVIDESDSDDYDNDSISSERSSTSSIKNNACFI